MGDETCTCFLFSNGLYQFINSFLRTHSLMFLTRGWTPLKGTSSVSWFISEAQYMLL